MCNFEDACEELQRYVEMALLEAKPGQHIVYESVIEILKDNHAYSDAIYNLVQEEFHKKKGAGR